VLDDHYPAMNRRVAPISILRVGDENGWPFWELSSAMVEVVTAFFKCLLEDGRRWFEEAEGTDFWERAEALRLPPMNDLRSATTVSDPGFRQVVVE
jgi:hypothetical protein